MEKMNKERKNGRIKKRRKNKINGKTKLDGH